MAIYCLATQRIIEKLHSRPFKDVICVIFMCAYVWRCGHVWVHATEKQVPAKPESIGSLGAAVTYSGVLYNMDTWKATWVLWKHSSDLNT